MMWSFQDPNHLGLPIERKAHWGILDFAPHLPSSLGHVTYYRIQLDKTETKKQKPYRELLCIFIGLHCEAAELSDSIINPIIMYLGKNLNDWRKGFGLFSLVTHFPLLFIQPRTKLNQAI